MGGKQGTMAGRRETREQWNIKGKEAGMDGGEKGRRQGRV